MPTYEYLCPEGHEFELIQKMSEKPRAKCPVCGRMATRQISGGAGLVFKGSGFYITDYGKDGKGPRKETEAATGDKASGDKASGDNAPGDQATGEKATGDKTTGDKTTGDKAMGTGSGADKPAADKSPKAKSHSKKARE
jgi:putative FmdB family regulatory protein